MQEDLVLDHIKGIDGGTLICSIWLGYKKKAKYKKFHKLY